MAWDEEEDAAAAALQELEDLCASSHYFSIESLREEISKKVFDDIDITGSSFFLKACLNEMVTLEIIEYLLECFPDAAENLGSWTVVDGPDELNRFFEIKIEAYPLHCCAQNDHCPAEVIKLLIEKYPAALEEFCFLNTLLFPGEELRRVRRALPLHYYMARPTNVDIDTVRVLVEAYPQALLAGAGSETRYTPLHIAVCNPNVNAFLPVILPYLLSVEPSVIEAVDGYGETLLHIACGKNVVVEVVERLFNAWPEAMHMRSTGLGSLPISILCENGHMDETNSLSILRFMLDVGPDLPMYSSDTYLPIHHAVAAKSTNFCKELINACPESLCADLNSSYLPIHEACENGNRLDALDTIQYMLEVYPESIHARVWESTQGMIFNGDGFLPIHCAAKGNSTEILEFLLMHDPDAAPRKVLYPPFPVPESLNSKYCEGALPLHIAAFYGKMKQTEILYDAFPEAILVVTKRGDSPLDLAGKYASYTESPTVEEFLETQLEYARISQDMKAMTAVDDIGRLPLHHALKGNASLGTIKLMVRGNPSAFVADQRGGFPLHIACEFSSLKVVKFLVELCENNLRSSCTTSNMMLECACCGEGESSSNRLKLCTACKMVKYCNVTCQKNHRSQHKKECKKRAAELQVEALFNPPMPKEDCDVFNHCDVNKDSILHYACRGGNLAIVKYLLGSHAPLVALATVNAKGELPIHLLCQAGKEEKVDKDCTEYMETIWQLLLANPELLFSASSIFEGESLDQAESEAPQEIRGERFDDEVTKKKKSWRKKLNPIRQFSRKG
eukprot:CAMPEP_0201718608 /NCGR_PEP_ID=MMETSP0593-20130828/4083_1 /ASSEMBLY_ACC=CAM_ASM_000672 /TAXON_ID=267983 /ORGANISM="Skeletonema japonicum, Strain CCMP2506" /LENGTH=789 /DNA_ID=CAMNT_0048208949 /DNA_START=76 /DNA_END=2445 /DNA_ORIENTATION=+